MLEVGGWRLKFSLSLNLSLNFISVRDIAQSSGTTEKGKLGRMEENSGRRKRLQISNFQCLISKFMIHNSQFTFELNESFLFFLSIGYIAGIFLFADSPVVSDVAAFQPL